LLSVLGLCELLFYFTNLGLMMFGYCAVCLVWGLVIGATLCSLRRSRHCYSRRFITLIFGLIALKTLFCGFGKHLRNS